MDVDDHLPDIIREALTDNDIAEEMKFRLARLEPAKRLELIAELTAGFCRSCGCMLADASKRCYCERDD